MPILLLLLVLVAIGGTPGLWFAALALLFIGLAEFLN